jgi:hypothetical protein
VNAFITATKKDSKLAITWYQLAYLQFERGIYKMKKHAFQQVVKLFTLDDQDFIFWEDIGEKLKIIGLYQDSF